jgi:hypothetical protein
MDCIDNKYQIEIINLLKKSYNLHELLNIYYIQFWKNIYFNDSYILYKQAITFYKNNQNGNFHGGFGFILNEYLFKGSCQYVDNKKKETFNTDLNIKTTTDDLCRLAINIINILDEIFEIVPKTPIPIISYRVEQRPFNDPIFNMKKGDIYKSLTYLMTSIYPLHIFDNPHYIGENNNNIKINFILIIPNGSKTYYLHNPFFFLWDNQVFKNNIINDKYIAHQENELVISRGSYWKLIEKINIDNSNVVFIIQLISQPINNSMSNNKYKLSKNIYTEKEFENLNINFNFNKDLIKEYQESIDIKLKMIKLNQKYSILEKTYEGKQNNLVWDIENIIKKKIKSKYFLSLMNNKFPNFFKDFPKIILKKKSNIQIYINPSSPYYWQFINNKYHFDGVLKIYNSKYDNKYKDIRQQFYYQDFTASEIYTTDILITNRRQITKHLFYHYHKLPLFFIFNLKLNNNIEVYDLYPYKKKYDPFKDYLLIGNYKFNIKNNNKIFLSDYRFYNCLDGFLI